MIFKRYFKIIINAIYWLCLILTLEVKQKNLKYWLKSRYSLKFLFYNVKRYTSTKRILASFLWNSFILFVWLMAQKSFWKNASTQPTILLKTNDRLTPSWSFSYDFHRLLLSFNSDMLAKCRLYHNRYLDNGRKTICNNKF